MNYYDHNAEILFKRYQSATTEMVHGYWLNLLPAEPGTVCDIGAGSGRDAAWFARKGWDVTAIEPSEKLRKLGESFTLVTLDQSNSVKWLDDSLPHLANLITTEKRFDLIILSAVWMHLQPDQYLPAMSALQCLLKPNGLLVISLRNGPDPEKRFFKTSLDELIETAVSCTLQLVKKNENQEDTNRPELSWDSAVFRHNGIDRAHGDSM